MLVTEQNRWRKVLTYTLLIAGLVIVAVPFLLMISTSVKPQSYVFEYPPRLIPSEVTFDNYIEALDTDQFGKYFFNSLKVALFTTITTLLIASMLAYAFARLKFPGKELLFYVLLLGMMVPPVMLIIPQFLVAKTITQLGFKLLDSTAGLVVVYVAMNLPMQTFLLRGFFEDIPSELEDAVKIDGGGHWSIFRHVILPLSRPGLATAAIFTFVYSWEEFPWAHVCIKDTTRRTLPIAIMLFQRQQLTQWGQVFAASIVALIPIVLVFVSLQRYFIRGISHTGLKG